MTILNQYRQWRQTNDPNELYRLADRLDLLSDHERHVGSIHSVRQGQVARRVESILGNPEQVLANAIYLKLYEYGIITVAYHNYKVSDDTLTLYCQLRSKGYWTGSLTPQETEWLRTIDDLETESGYPVSDAVEEAIAQYFGNREMAA